MSPIPSRYYNEPPYRIRKTITFDGSAENGAIGTVLVAAITGRVWIEKLTVFCTETLVGATATIELGHAAFSGAICGSTTATAIAANDWWAGTVQLPGSMNQAMSASNNQIVSGLWKSMSQDIILTIATANITDGTLVIDLWFEPITDDGNLT